MINWKFLTIPITIACASLGLASCGEKPEPVASPVRPSFHVYMVFSPIDPDATTLARQFIANAKKNIQGKTQIIIPDNTYTVGEICQGNLPSFPLSYSKVEDKSGIQAVTDQIQNSLRDISEGKKTCNAKAESLVNLSTNLNQTPASDNPLKMILIIQTPWPGREINDTTFKQLKDGMEKLSKTGKVEKVILIGVNPSGSDRLAQAFESFQKLNQLSSTVDIPQTIGSMKTIRKDYLKVAD